MQAYRLIASLFLAHALLGGQRVPADSMDNPLGTLQPERARVVVAGRWVAKGTLQPPPVPRLSLQGSGDVEVAAQSSPRQEGSAPALTLGDLERIALESNPTLVQARVAVRAAQGQFVQAGLYPNPTVGYLADEIGNDGSSGLQGGLISQEFVTAGKLRLRRAVAGYQIQQARWAWEAQRQRVLNDVRAGYYEVLLGQKMIELNQELLAIGNQGVEVTRKLREALEVSRANVLQARIEAETAKLNLNEAKNQHRSAWRRLAAVLGRPEMAALADTEPDPLVGEVDKDLPEFTWEDSLARLLAQSPELRRAWARVERARCELALQFAARKPNVELGTAVKYDDATRFTVVDLQLALPLPLFDRNQGNIVRAQAELIAAENEVRRVELSLQERLAEVFGQYANAREQAETYAATILPDARASLDLVRAGYREGEFGYLTLLTAQRTFFNVNLDYLNSLRELWVRSVELEGMLLRRGLEGPKLVR